MEKFINRRDKQEIKERNPKKGSQPKKQSWHTDKRVRIGAAVIGGVIIVIAAVIIWFQMSANRTIQELTTAKENTTAQVQSLQSSYTKTPLKERSAKLQKIASEIKIVPCKNLSHLPWFAEAKKNCLAFAHKSEVLRNELVKLADMQAYDAYITAQLAPIQKSKDTIADYKAEADKWKKVQTALEKAPKKASLDKAHAQLTAATKSITNNWQLITAADKDKNAKNFTKNREALGEKYATLKSAGEKLTEEYTAAQQRVVKAYQAYQKQTVDNR